MTSGRQPNASELTHAWPRVHEHLYYDMPKAISYTTLRCWKLARSYKTYHTKSFRRRTNMTAIPASADDFEEHVESTALPGQQSTKHFPPSERPNACTRTLDNLQSEPDR